MPLKITDKTADARLKFNNVSSKEDATPEQINAAMEEYITAIAEDAGKQVRDEYEELKNVNDNQILQARGIHVLTAEENAYYNEVIKTGGLDTELLTPPTIIERVFEDMQEERPLLKLITFTPGIGSKKIIRGRRKGKAVWGPLHRDLEGQLDAEFDATTNELHNLTAFFLISNDTLDLGPRWIDRYVRLCLKEATMEAWEEAIVLGTGNNQPIGMMKDLDAPVTGGVYADKESVGTLTFKDAATMVKEFAGVMKKMSQYTHKIGDNDEGEAKTRRVRGSVKLLINPANYFDIIARVTTQNANGVFVSNLPFIPETDIVESIYVPENKLIAFLDGDYEASASNSDRIYVYKETFAMKRATLYAIDLFGDGEPTNNDAAQIYDIEISVEGSTPTAPEETPVVPAG